jgi:hypothetical protein
MAAVPTVATARARRQHYRHNMLTGFDAPAELYYAYWGEYFHGDLEPRRRLGSLHPQGALLSQGM